MVAAYFERREELLRYFRVRLRSPEAAEDVVQEIYLKLVRRPPEAVENPTAFLYRLGTNVMLDQIKLERRVQRRATAWREATLETDGGGAAASEAPPADRALAARERLSLILATVDEMPEPVRKAFRLHKLEGLTHAETAARMGVSRSSVEKYIMTALKRLIEKVGP